MITRILQRNTVSLTTISFLFFALSFGFVSVTFAQQPNTTKPKSVPTKEVKGTVATASGDKLEGVTIKLKGTETVAVTKADGTFSIKVPTSLKPAMLQLTSVGYETKEVNVTSVSNVNVTLTASSSTMDEVVVIGYGTIKRKDLTGSVGKVSIEDLQKAPVMAVDQALAGRVAGVQVVSSDGQPDGTSDIIIRGTGSVTQSSSPLYVIDGFPQEVANFNALNPADIESIEVLKDASSTAIYGARGSNGVIMITTKKGKSPSPQLTYTGSYGFQNPTKFMKLMGPYEFVRLQNDMNPVFANNVYFANGKTLEDYRNAPNIDWQDLLFRDRAAFQQHNIALSAKVNKTSYAISASYGKQEGLIINSGFDRYQARVVLDQDVNDKLKIGINANFAKFKGYGQTPANQNTPLGNSANSSNFNFMTNLWSFRPVLGAKATDYSFVYEDLLDNNVDEGGVPGSGRVNPYITALNEVSDRFNTTVLANGYVQYKIVKNLVLKSTIGINLVTDESFRFNNSQTNSGSPLTSYGQINGVNGSTSKGTTQSILNENTLSYNFNLGKKHVFNAVVGATNQTYNTESYGFSATKLPNEALGYKGLGQGTPYRTSSAASRNAIESYLGRINYTLNNKYLFTASFRADGSSKFAPENRWGYFPSGAFAWKLSNENFMRKLRFVDEAKLRTSLGATGNNRVSDFAYLSLLTANTSSNSGSFYSFNDQTLYNIVVSSLGNRNLKWETGLQTDLGLELSLFNKRLNVEIDYYKRVTKNLLINSPVPLATGFTSAFTNVGTVSNEGLELSLSTLNIAKKNFRWTSSFNISFNKNRLEALNSGEASLLTIRAFDASVSTNPNYIARVGAPVAQFYGLISAGMYQFDDFYRLPNGPGANIYVLKENIPYYGTRNTLSAVQTDTRVSVQPGDPKFVDTNGDGVIDANDYTVIGNPYPIHYGGFNNNFTYKNFELSVFMQWSYGNDIINANRLKFEGGTNASVTLTSLGATGGGVNFNMFDTYKNRWTPENPSNMYPRVNAHAGGTRQYSTRIVEDGSYLRLKTVQLAYVLPAKIVKKIKIVSARFYLSAQNLLTFTNYTGPDPEVNVASGNSLTPGLDYSPYPRTRVLTIGTSITL